jgi:hypothetical protein
MDEQTRQLLENTPALTDAQVVAVTPIQQLIRYHREAAIHMDSVYQESHAQYVGMNPPGVNDHTHRFQEGIPMTFPRGVSFGKSFSPKGRQLDETGMVDLNRNLVYQIVDTVRTNVAPRRPQVEIAPLNSLISPDTTKTMEGLVNNAFNRNRLTATLDGAVTHASLFGVAFVLISWDKGSLTPRFRLVHRRDVFWDMEAQQAEDMTYIAHRYYLSEQEFYSRFASQQYINGRACFNLQSTNQQDSGYNSNFPLSCDTVPGADTVRQGLPRVMNTEFFDLENDRHYHFAGENLECVRITQLPYRTVRNPFTPIIFIDALDGFNGVSDIQLVQAMIENLRALDSAQLRHAESSIPKTIVADNVFADPALLVEDVAKSSDPGEIIIARMAGTLQSMGTLASAFFTTPQPTLNPDFQRMRQELLDFAFSTVGINNVQRGQLGQSDVATELALADAGNQQRVERRIQRVGWAIEDLARKTIDLYVEFLSVNQQVAFRVPNGVKTVSGRELQGYFGSGVSSLESLDISVIPYTPLEQTRSTRLRRIMELLQTLMVLAPNAVNTQRVAEEIVQLAALPSDSLYSLEEQANMAKSEADAAAAAATPPQQEGLPALDPGQVRGGVSQATQNLGAPRAIGAMVGGAGVAGPRARR